MISASRRESDHANKKESMRTSSEKIDTNVDNFDLELVEQRIRRSNKEYISKAEQLREIHTNLRALAKQTGEDLIAVKDHLKHGEFLAWLEKAFGQDLSERQARHYMAFARGDADTLHAGTPLKSAPGADSPHPLTDLQEKAIELVKQGKSYRQIGKELDTDEANIRKDPAIRAARLEVDPDAHSTTNYDSIAACRTSSADERIRSIKTDLEMLVDKHFYTLSKRDQKRLKDILEQGLEALKSYA